MVSKSPEGAVQVLARTAARELADFVTAGNAAATSRSVDLGRQLKAIAGEPPGPNRIGQDRPGWLTSRLVNEGCSISSRSAAGAPPTRKPEAPLQLRTATRHVVCLPPIDRVCDLLHKHPSGKEIAARYNPDRVFILPPNAWAVVWSDVGRPLWQRLQDPGIVCRD